MKESQLITRRINDTLPHSPFNAPAGADSPTAPASPLSMLISPDGIPAVIASTRDAQLFCFHNPGWSCQEYGDGEFD